MTTHLKGESFDLVMYVHVFTLRKIRKYLNPKRTSTVVHIQNVSIYTRQVRNAATLYIITEPEKAGQHYRIVPITVYSV